MRSNKMSGIVIHNKMLLSLPKNSLNKLLEEFKAIHLPLGEDLFKPGDKVDSAIFVNSGLVSLIAASSTGRSIAVASVGKEGMLPVEVLSGLQCSAYTYVVRIPGEALKISTAAFKDLRSSDSAFREGSLKFFQQLHSQSAQLILCNRFHSVQQRLCRWILMSSDWAEDDQFPMTHEFLSLMLGVNRSTVSLELGALKADGMISYRQRLLRITDKRRIASISCECYWSHKRDMDAYTKALAASGTSGASGTRPGRSFTTGAYRSTDITVI